MLNSSILNLFARSPIKPMHQHMDIIYNCAAELIPFFNSALQQNWELTGNIHSKILQLESSADSLKKEIRLNLPNSLFLPVARSDLLALLIQQDKIASRAKHIAGIVYGRRMTLCSSIEQELICFVQRNIDAVALAKKAIHELEELVETGFKGREVAMVSDMITELENVERDTDNMQVNIRQSLFKIEQSLNPVEVVFLYRVFDWIADLANKAQNVGQCLETFLAQ